MNNKYGYKISYREFGNTKLKIYLVTNTLDGAIWNIRWYENHPQQDRLDKHYLRNPTWFLDEVKTKTEYNKLWKGCPFKEDF
jgi:hypothetical protein